jgi:hypothetical protein
MAAAGRVEEGSHELGGRVTDVERLVIELQDSVPPDAYRRGFPGPGDGRDGAGCAAPGQR